MLSDEVNMVDPSTIPPLPQVPTPLPTAAPQQQFGQGGMVPQHGIPQFEVVAVRRADGSYANVEYVNILTPGDPKSVPRHKVTDVHRQMYRQWYDAWRRGLEMAPEGTPLEMWSVITPAIMHTLKAINIFTVEQLANIPDSNIHRVPMGHDMKNKARVWLKNKGEDDAIENSRREKEALENSLRMQDDKIAALTKQLEGLMADKASDTEAVKRGPGRPPNKAS